MADESGIYEVYSGKDDGNDEADLSDPGYCTEDWMSEGNHLGKSEVDHLSEIAKQNCVSSSKKLPLTCEESREDFADVDHRNICKRLKLNAETLHVEPSKNAQVCLAEVHRIKEPRGEDFAISSNFFKKKNALPHTSVTRSGIPNNSYDFDNALENNGHSLPLCKRSDDTDCKPCIHNAQQLNIYETNYSEDPHLRFGSHVHSDYSNEQNSCQKAETASATEPERGWYEEQRGSNNLHLDPIADDHRGKRKISKLCQSSKRQKMQEILEEGDADESFPCQINGFGNLVFTGSQNCTFNIYKTDDNDISDDADDQSHKWAGVDPDLLQEPQTSKIFEGFRKLSENLERFVDCKKLARLLSSTECDSLEEELVSLTGRKFPKSKKIYSVLARWWRCNNYGENVKDVIESLRSVLEYLGLIRISRNIESYFN